MTRNENISYTTRRIGNTTYKVKIAFSENSTETMEDKIIRIIKNEILAKVEKCGIMDLPQMSRQSERSA